MRDAVTIEEGVDDRIKLLHSVGLRFDYPNIHYMYIIIQNNKYKIQNNVYSISYTMAFNSLQYFYRVINIRFEYY
jgi:hypothetical protein